MPQRREVGLVASRIERDPPGSGYGVTAAVGVQGVHIEFGERDIPPAGPGIVGKSVTVDLGRHGQCGP